MNPEETNVLSLFSCISELPPLEKIRNVLQEKWGKSPMKFRVFPLDWLVSSLHLYSIKLIGELIWGKVKSCF